MNASPYAHIPASPWVCGIAGAVVAGGTVLDVAAGSGRHSEYFLARGHPVVAVDRDTSALVRLAPLGKLEIVTADLEAGPWPFGTRRFAGVVVTNYLYRPLLPTLVDAVAPEGVLIYETFAVGNERFGKPSNPDFLLRPGELKEAVHGQLKIIAYQEGEVDVPRRAVVQSIAAMRMP
jgi:SAM-dependent methyltransferase